MDGNNKTKIKDLPNGCIVWYKREIIGITGLSLSHEYDDFNVVKVPGNPLDYELMARKTRNGYVRVEE